MRNIKLQDALLFIGHQAEKLDKAPTPEELRQAFEQLMAAIEKNDMKGMSKLSREFGGGLVRWMVEKL